MCLESVLDETILVMAVIAFAFPRILRLVFHRFIEVMK